MATVELEQVDVTINRTAVLRDVTLDVRDGDFVGIVGESGSGKSTLLRAIAGLVRAVRGEIRIGGVDVTDASPGQRDVGMVFQEPALLANRSVRRNVSFPLEVRRQHAEEIRRRVDAEARALHLEHLLSRHPDELSVGEQQMVQIARALVRVPKVLLLDEPFAALDEPLRRRMRSEIAMLQDGYGVTTLMTTNDVRDVEALARTLVVVDDGRVVQCASRDVVRSAPATLLAAAATGSLTTLEVRVVGDGAGYWLVRDDPSGGPAFRHRVWAPGYASLVGRIVTMTVRCDDACVSDAGSVVAIVERVLPGWPPIVHCRVAGAVIMATADSAHPAAVGDRVTLRVDRHSVFDTLTGAALV
jgi:ABC-type sugar transport system ATPase subunit